MKTLVLGAGGGLGRNLVDAALRAGHEVRAFVRQVHGDALPAGVRVIVGDATRQQDVTDAARGVDAVHFCLNPRLSRWLDDFPPLLKTAMAAASDAGARLIFPGNVWIYGPGQPHLPVDEARAASPTSQRGRLRAAMEQTLRASGCRFSIIRLPEFYGPRVVTLTARAFRAALRGGRTFWPGPLHAEVEFVFMPDAAQALIEVSRAADVDGEVFHLPGIRTTPWTFIHDIYQAAGNPTKLLRIPKLALKLAGLVNATARAVADIAHLWTQPILLDGSRYARRFGSIPQTPYQEGIAQTLAWHRGVPDLALQG